MAEETCGTGNLRNKTKAEETNSLCVHQRNMLNPPTAGKDEVSGSSRGYSAVGSGSRFFKEEAEIESSVIETVATSATTATAVITAETTAASAATTAAAEASEETGTESPSLRRREIFDPHSKFKGMRR